MSVGPSRLTYKGIAIADLSPQEFATAHRFAFNCCLNTHPADPAHWFWRAFNSEMGKIKAARVKARIFAH